ncbi:uncharacterized protein CTRU02_210485 [Colletotrichum truncatum]|uniref:Uncharacterized protein n=1 Tax=Colletotrichum truncatum TaxID=5467 RepID=A0ACC3YP89_COLTU|nr:uncharacterized protein CTRU02_15653 [Colletotrichum truncatum]XP_036576073.1 uncharacterized protein CTRU02_13913 [Colletotrichum truncatum]KAF6780820.1 hypothetical protein CTRU02_15653 [Colletotrichum truncatum]KAF6782756.1 hypothetical protein CTRU02_13913 [Colletotrichum truncatum]
MAANGNPKARNSAGVANGRPASARRVVPAIPLTYERRLKANAAAKHAAAQAQSVPVASLPRPAATTNGSSLKIQNDVDAATLTPKSIEPESIARDEKPAAVEEPAVVAPADDSNNDDVKDREDLLSQQSSTTIPASSDAELSKSTDKTEQDAPSSIKESAPGRLPAGRHHIYQELSSSHFAENRRVTSPPSARAAQMENSQLPPTFRPPPVIPPSRYNMPPGAHNGPRPSPVVINGTSHRGPRSVHNGPPHMHGPRPSNGSLVQFGGFGSNSSSPAPPHSGGFMPPNGAPMPDGRQIYNHAAAATNGYHHQMPYGTEFVPGTGVDQFGRPIPGPAGMEQYHPYVNGYGPSTPHSFQGSHSSAQAEDAGAYNPYPAPGIPNGAAHVDDARSHPPPAGAFGVPPQRMMPGPIPPPHMMHHGHEAQGLDGLAAYLRSQFRDTALADCTLELRYLDDRAPPVRIPGHRLVLARSQVVKNILETESFETSPPGTNRTILLQSEDKYLRSDAFWMAVQHLYAFPLLELPEPSTNGGLTLAGSADDRFDFALGYAAAGHALGWHPIVVRGLEIASHSLSWATIERAIEFALADVPGRASADRHTQFAYGDPVQILMNGIINFLVNNFPPDFTLDTSVSDPERFARIPFVPASPPAREGTPTIARGTSAKDRRSRPMHIQFGDLAVNQDAGSKGSEPAPPSPQQRNIQSVLSTILINLPFAFLKPTLESSGYGNVNGWANVEARHHIMRAVVNERETRRGRALEAVKAGAVPHAESILYGLQSVEPRQGEEWNGLGWREEVVSYVNGDAPSLGRQWVPLMVQNGSGHMEQLSRPAYP